MADAYKIPDREHIFRILTESLDQPIDLESVKKSFEGIQKDLLKSKITTLQKELDRHHSLEESLLETYRKSLKVKEQLSKKLHELQTSSTSFVDEILKIMPSLIEKDIVKTITVEGSTLIVKMSTSLFNYNELAVKKIVEQDYHDSRIIKLLKRALLDNDYEIMFTSSIIINFVNFGIESNWRFDTSNTRILRQKTRREHMYYPNPHLTNFNCFGQNGPALIQLLKKGQYSEFFMALIATIGNLNFNDGVVTSRFYAFLIQEDNNLAFIRDVKTNEMLTMKKFMEKENESSKA